MNQIIIASIIFLLIGCVPPDESKGIKVDLDTAKSSNDKINKEKFSDMFGEQVDLGNQSDAETQIDFQFDFKKEEFGIKGCLTDIECDDSNPCTEDFCLNQSECVHLEIIDCCQPYDFRECGVTNVGVCNLGTQYCQENYTWGDCLGAVYPQKEQCNGIDDDCDGKTDNECCSQDSDCEDGNPCAQPKCVDKSCHYFFIKGCCITGKYDCNDHNVCTNDICMQGNCINMWIDSFCCEGSAQCYDDDICTEDVCEKGFCKHKKIDKCCFSDNDCEPTDINCYCWTIKDVRCSYFNGLCDLDENWCQEIILSKEPCSFGCKNGKCLCKTNADCYNLPCKINECQSGVCVSKQIPGCIPPKIY